LTRGPEGDESSLAPLPPGDPEPAPDPRADDIPGDDGPRPTTFSLEGRAVPGLYFVGWLASLTGAVLVGMSFVANVPGAGRILVLVGLVLLGIGLFAATGSQAVERGRRPELAYRGPSPVLAFLAVVVLTLLVLVVVLAPLSALGLDARSPLATTLNLLLTTALYIGVVRLLVVGPGALSWRDMGVVRPDGAALRELLAGAVLAVPVLVVTLALGLVLSRFLSPPPSPLPEAGDALGIMANLLSAAILAPIGEELFFRGFATTAWARAAGPTAAIIRGAVFFAFAHVVTLFDTSFETGAQRALFSFLGLMPVAIVLGWVFLRRRSLYAAIGLHGAFNAIQILLLVAASGAVPPA
jgi:membrane protease YdiL (CAAX protease family)